MTTTSIEKKELKSKEKIKLSVWKSFSTTEYQKSAHEMVHFSAKTVNSNTLPFGIRLSAKHQLDLSYVSASTIDRAMLPMDYIKMGKPSATKQINAVCHDALSKFSDISEEEVMTIQECVVPILMTAYESEVSIGIRLRQIILQDTEGNDIAATPLPCAGLSVVIAQRIQEEWEVDSLRDEKEKKDKEFISRKFGYLGVGGANPQNVGLNVRAMQKPLLFRVPSITNKDSQELRYAWSIYYKGITQNTRCFKLNSKLLEQFIISQKNYFSKHFVDEPTKLIFRQQESKFISDLTKDFMRQVVGAQQLLRSYMEKLPDGKICSNDLPFLDQALLDDSLRDMAWVHEFASWLHGRMLNQSVWIKGEKKTLGRSKYETTQWRNSIEEELL